jgi:hypothetical protein
MILSCDWLDDAHTVGERHYRMISRPGNLVTSEMEARFTLVIERRLAEAGFEKFIVHPIYAAALRGS